MTSHPACLANRKIQKRSVKIAGHATSVSLEEDFWDALKGIASARNLSINGLIEEIDRKRSTDIKEAPTNLSSAVRVFVLHSRIL